MLKTLEFGIDMMSYKDGNKLQLMATKTLERGTDILVSEMSVINYHKCPKYTLNGPIRCPQSSVRD